MLQRASCRSYHLDYLLFTNTSKRFWRFINKMLIFTKKATDLVLLNKFTKDLVPPIIKTSALREISRALEEAIDLVKTRQGDAKVILVGGGSIIIGDKIAGVGEIIRPKYLEVANAVGAAVCAIDALWSHMADACRSGKSAAQWTRLWSQEEEALTRNSKMRKPWRLSDVSRLGATGKPLRSWN
jgi:hypothetical protein